MTHHQSVTLTSLTAVFHLNGSHMTAFLIIVLYMCLSGSFWVNIGVQRLNILHVKRPEAFFWYCSSGSSFQSSDHMLFDLLLGRVISS